MREVADAAAGPEVHGKIGDVLAVQQDTPVIGARQSDQDVKSRGLSSAIRPEQPYYLALLNLQTDVINDFPATV